MTERVFKPRWIVRVDLRAIAVFRELEDAQRIVGFWAEHDDGPLYQGDDICITEFATGENYEYLDNMWSVTPHLTQEGQALAFIRESAYNLMLGH